MRDFLLNEALKRLAIEAATRFSALVAAGDQIPFDVAAEDGEDSAFYSYVPLTARYVAERSDELRSLPSFAPAREAVVEAGVAASYLESRGEAVPADPGERAERMLAIFVSSLWDGCTEFSLDRARLDSSLSMLDAEGRDADDAEVLIVPVVGLRMSLQPAAAAERRAGRPRRLDRGPDRRDAQRGHGPRRLGAPVPRRRRAARERGCRRGAAPAARADQRDAALQERRDRPRPLRLRPDRGGVLAPDRDRRSRHPPRRLPPQRERGGRAGRASASTLEARPDPDSALTWAVGRFEMGCERESALDGLSDHLLALRAVLEGHGPVGASLPLRAAALISDDSLDRIEAREKVEDTLELERSLMNGRPVAGAMELAGWAEEGVRRLLLQAALGELGDDLSTTADETLIATGLDAGDAEIAVTVARRSSSSRSTPRAGRAACRADRARSPSPIERFREPSHRRTTEETMEQETRIMEPIPAEDEIKITATPWLEEVSDARRGDSLEWPAAGDRDLQHRERIDTPRVRHLFPVPEDADWEVSHLEFDYGHYGRDAS